MGSRCTGRCCKKFSLPHPIEWFFDLYKQWLANQKQEVVTETVWRDIHLLAPMLVPLGQYEDEWLYTRKHFSVGGDCTIYDMRPSMCKNFPYGKSCPFSGCEWSSVNGSKKPKRRKTKRIMRATT